MKSIEFLLGCHPSQISWPDDFDRKASVVRRGRDHFVRISPEDHLFSVLLRAQHIALNGHKAQDLVPFAAGFAQEETTKLVDENHKLQAQILDFKHTAEETEKERDLLKDVAKSNTDLSKGQGFRDQIRALNLLLEDAKDNGEIAARRVAQIHARILEIIDEVQAREFEAVRGRVEEQARAFNSAIATAYRTFGAVVARDFPKLAGLSANTNLPCPPHVYFTRPELDVSVGRRLKLLELAPQVVWKNGYFGFELREVKFDK